MDFTYKLIVDGTDVIPLDYPNVNFNAVFNTIDFSLSSEASYTEGIINRIKDNNYCNCIYSINGNQSNFILDTYNIDAEFGTNSVSFSGLSKTALIEERFSGYFNTEGTTSVSSALNLCKNKMNSYGVTTPELISMSGEVETEGKSVLTLLQDIEGKSELTLASSYDGLSLRYIGGIYNSTHVSSFISFSNFESFTKYNISMEVGFGYDKVIIVSGEDNEKVGSLILETEKLSYDTYLLKVYSEPLLSNFTSFNVRVSDGVIKQVANKEIVSVEELKDFSQDVASLQYPVNNILETTFYNKVNTLTYSVGFRDVGLSVSDDIACAKIAYRTMRNVYRISGLTEPLMKLAVEVS